MKEKTLPFLLFLSLLSCESRPKVLWTFETGAPIYGSPAISENRLIVGSNDHFLYALNLQNGKQIWKTNLGDRLISSPLVDRNSIYIGGANGYFFALDAADGTIRWKFKTDDKIHYTACADEEGIYFGSYDKRFYKLDRSGRKLWDFQARHRVCSSCVFYKNLVLTSSWDSHFYAIETETGNPAWKISTGTINNSTPALHRDSVYCASHDKLYGFDASTGKVLFLEKSKYHLENILVEEGSLWTNEKGLFQRTLDGKIVGKVEFDAMNTFRPVAYNGFLIQATKMNSLYGISKELEIVWEFEAGDIFWASGVVRNGIYYTGNRDGNVYALRLPR